jgi:flagellar hook-associated protein 1 FlgK
VADLFNSLSLAARSLDADMFGLNVTGQNIANINTPGYVRRTANLAAIPPTEQRSAGNGVEVVGVEAQRAVLLEGRLRHEQSASGRESAAADSLSLIEGVLGDPGTSIDAALTQFYDAFSQLAQNPTSGSVRQQVVTQGQSLANSFNDVSSRLEFARRSADTDLRSGIDQVNALASQIAALNASISKSGRSESESLIDNLTQALSQLSSLVDVSVISRPDGGADVSIGNGRALVIGSSQFQLSATSNSSGFADLTSGSATITSEITGGRLGGLLEARDVLIPGYVNQLDRLAYGVASSVNTVHRASYDLNGTAGGDFFASVSSVSGAAQAINVSGAIVGNVNLVAAAGSTSAGDNQGARAIADLRNSPITGGQSTPTDTWGALVYRVATDSQVAKTEQSSRSDIIQQLQKLRDQVSGVSLDEEAAMMLKFQRAYEANARYFTAINQTLDLLMGLAR